MNNEVFEADYTRKDEPSPDTGLGILELAKDTGFFRAYDDLMRSMPKIINQRDKQNYEELLHKLDALAKRKGGKIKGIVDYEHWDAHIYITLPFFEFVHKDEVALLKELETKANTLTFTVTDDGKIQLSVMIHYFEEIGDKSTLFSQAIEGNDKLIEALTANAERRKQSIMDSPVVGKVIETAAGNLGISAKEFLDRAFGDDDDPELQMQLIAAILKAKEDTPEDE